MSWIEQLNNVQVTIKMGDGVTFSPLWKEATRTKNYNISAYNFIGVAGTLIDRKLPEGYQYDVNIIFQGEDHIDIAKSFQSSADDPRFWTITHPYWGDIKVQPISIEEDKSSLNVTIFKIKVWETIASVYPVQKQYSNDKVYELRDTVNDAAALSLESQIPEIPTSLRTTLYSSIENIDNIAASSITGLYYSKFKEEVAKAKRYVNDSTREPIDVIRAIIDIINYPVEVISSVQDRINILTELKDKLTDILFVSNTKNNIIVYEIVTSGILANMAMAAMTPADTDYQIRTEVIDVVTNLQDDYASYLELLDEYQADRSDEIDTFTPNMDINRYLNEAIMEALSNIYDYAFEAKQERIILLEKDSNAILLTHRFYGMDTDDENLSFFIKTNNLSLNELIQIKKGRKIIYYV